ncbi:hypothetical protein AJ88_46545 [Mesorhizobium amorphae CCBAU 01583]|nr:hypothetical protein AJ88_46545 [Mesorhizobium amorphae CCBAU 01583]
MALKKEDTLEAGILQDQLADLRAGLFVSMPISTVLSGLILAVQTLSGNGSGAAIWFLVVNAINVGRLAFARYQLKDTRRQGDLTRYRRGFAGLASLLFWRGLPGPFLLS